MKSIGAKLKNSFDFLVISTRLSSFLLKQYCQVVFLAIFLQSRNLRISFRFALLCIIDVSFLHFLLSLALTLVCLNTLLANYIFKEFFGDSAPKTMKSTKQQSQLSGSNKSTIKAGFDSCFLLMF